MRTGARIGEESARGLAHSRTLARARACFCQTKALRGFTLIEVLLSVGILAGLLVVVLYFYQQAAELRTELLLETERSSSARLLMDRLTTELRTARTHTFYEVPMVGDATYLQFITTDVPSQEAWTGEKLGRITRPESDLKLVSYGTETSLDDTNVLGLGRTEEALVELRTAPSETTIRGTAATNRASVLITDAFRFMRFRYYDGYDWLEAWSETYLPRGVEVTLGAEPLPPEVELAEYPYEVFRRVIALPASNEEDSMDFELPAETAAPQSAEVRR
jgi:prepilin-type N-terminal cleavage/methylation domain-containing protein